MAADDDRDRKRDSSARVAASDGNATGLRARTDRLPVAHELAFACDQAGTRAELTALYEKSKALMWNATTAPRWDIDIDPEREYVSDQMHTLFNSPVWAKLDAKRDIPRLRHHTAAWTLSNFWHGEQAALLASSQMVALLDTREGKLCATAQAFDEARHVEVFGRYLHEKLELVYPINPHLRELVDVVLTDGRADIKFIGMQIMIEGLALGAFRAVQKSWKEPLLQGITELVTQDEARHVAFGLLELKERFFDVSPSELRDREDFVIMSARLLHARLMGQEVWEMLGLPMSECAEIVRTSPTFAFYRDSWFSKIVPNVKRLGLLTPYVRKAFEELDILTFEHVEAGS